MGELANGLLDLLSDIGEYMMGVSVGVGEGEGDGLLDLLSDMGEYMIGVGVGEGEVMGSG